MIKQSIRKEIALLLKSESEKIIRQWSSNACRLPGYVRDKDIISRSSHRNGMRVILKNLLSDIKAPGKNSLEIILHNLVFRDYLSASSASDVIQTFMALRAILIDIISSAFSKDIRKFKAAVDIIIEAIADNVICVSEIYKRRDFTRLETIMMYGKKMVTVHDIDKLCELIIEAAVIESDSDRASLMLLEKDGYMYIKSSVGIPKHIAKKVKVKVGHGISGIVAKTGEPVILSKGYKIPNQMQRSMRGLGLKSALSIPLLTDHSVCGVLNLGKYKNKNFFDKNDAELLLILAYEAATAITNCRLFQEMHELYEGSIISLGAAIDARDHYTHGHSNRVTKIAADIGKRLKLDSGAIKRVELASMLHDIGKIGVPDCVLLKPGKLNDEEFEIIKKHPLYAVNILKHVPRLKDIIPIVYHEHEHYDGSWYPEGLKADAIPIESRIIAVADAYEAMTSNRPYRKAMPKLKALKEIKRCSGTQFDPDVVKAFLRIVNK